MSRPRNEKEIKGIEDVIIFLGGAVLAKQSQYAPVDLEQVVIEAMNRLESIMIALKNNEDNGGQSW